MIKIKPGVISNGNFKRIISINKRNVNQANTFVEENPGDRTEIENSRVNFSILQNNYFSNQNETHLVINNDESMV